MLSKGRFLLGLIVAFRLGEEAQLAFVVTRIVCHIQTFGKGCP
jgi:hypothetical protein